MTKHRIAPLALVLLLVGGACSSSDQSDETLSAINQGSSEEVLAGPAALNRTVDAPEVETAYGILNNCLANAGITGTLRFDLNRSASIVQDLGIGPDLEAGERKLAECFGPFDEILQTYTVTHPETAAQREAIHSGVKACADRLFPGELPDSGTVEDAIEGYIGLFWGSDVAVEAQACLDEAYAGPPRPVE